MAAVGNFVQQQGRERVIFLGSYLGMSGSVPDYWSNVSGYYLSRYVCYYLGGRGGSRAGARDACVFPMSQAVVAASRRSETIYHPISSTRHYSGVVR